MNQDPDLDTRQVSPPRRPSWSLIVAVAIVALAVGAAAGLIVGPRLVPSSGPVAPSDNSVDAGFARDMQTHHAQAVEMSMLIRDRSTDPAVRRLAFDIALTQQQQIGQMHAWLESWGLPQASGGPPMAWMPGAGHHEAMSHMGASSLMPGMATETELRELRQTRGTAAERLFLRLMIDHHRGGVTMARAAARHAEQPEVRRLAKTMVRGQIAEITAMKRMLTARSD